MSARNFEIRGERKSFGTVKIEKTQNYTNVILHNTTVVSLNRISNIVTLNSGGWKTFTTKTAINHALRQIVGFEKVSVYQKIGKWFVQDLVSGLVIPFSDNMALGGGFGAPITVLYPYQKEVG